MVPYPNPPITEALIDIRIDPLPESTLATLESLHDTVRGDYPNKETKKYWEGSVDIRENRPFATVQQHSQPIGFLFRSQDQKQIVQYRLDGFTFNRLRPYPSQGWPIIRDEARKLWEHYLHNIAPKSIARIGLRYINQINIPAPDQQIELEDYFTEPPRVPNGIPQTFENFLVRLVVPCPELAAKAIITQSCVPFSASATTLSFILDIEVLTNNTDPLDAVDVWDFLDRFREFKNKVFESSLTRKTKELFR